MAMFNSMKTTEIQTAVKRATVNALSIPENASQIDDYTYAVPVEVGGRTLYAKMVVTCCAWAPTKTHEAFDLDEAIAAYEFKVKERDQKAAERAAAKAAKAAKKSAK